MRLLHFTPAQKILASLILRCFSAVMLRLPFYCLLCALTVYVAPTTAAPHFKKFGSLHGQHYSEPTDVSADGLVFVGTADNRDEDARAVRREKKRPRLFELGTFAGSASEAWGVSANGAVVVGSSLNAAGAQRAFRWTTNGLRDLSAHQDWTSVARGVSADGTVVVGWFSLPYNAERPFRWTTGSGAVDLPTLGGDMGHANAVNGDGSVIVGAATDAMGILRACRWIVDTDPQPLSDLSEWNSEALSITPDGSVIVGSATGDGTNFYAFRWTAGSGLQSLQTNVTFLHSSAVDVSADGTRAVGTVVTDSQEEHAAIWTQQGGLEDMNVVYRSALPHGWTYVTAAAISANGRWIVGTALSPKRGLKGYMLDTGAPK
jgi:probable HAF family extracellular repeat protein